MLAFVNRSLLQPLAAWKNGSRHLHFLKELRQRQYDPPDIIRARQLADLRQMMLHAWNTVPYYRDAWQRAGVHPQDLRSLSDLRHFPITTKDDLRAQPGRFLSSDFHHARLWEKRTSGSTGVPITVMLDEAGKQWKQACTLRSDEWSGWRLGQRIAKVWGNPEYRRFGLRGRLRNRLLERAIYLDTLHITPKRLKRFIHALRRWPPGLLFGHAHSLYLLAQSVPPGVIRPNGIIATAMPLHHWQRRTIEAAFATRVTDRYGCEEVSLIASECELHHGWHVNADSVIVEVINPDDSGAGSVLVTDLCNRAMPLIRYRNGDVAALSDRRCPCGRGLPMIDRIMGRDADFVVTPGGGLISGISLTENFALKVPGTAQMQIIQESVTYLRIRIVPDHEFGEASRKRIARLVRETFGNEVEHAVELTERIEQEPSGKYRFCISKVARP